MTKNLKYSHKDFTHQVFTGVDAAEFNDSEIVGSCFYHEAAYDPDAQGNSPVDSMVHIFPPGMHGVTFLGCNLDNILVPGDPGTNLIGEGCSNRKIRVMNDMEDWVLGANHKPTEPMDKKRFESEGWSTSPANLPAEKQDKPRGNQ